MIFVCLAYEKVEQHTAGFLGLQIALVLIAVKNSLFVYDTNIGYDFLGGIRNTRIAFLAYLTGLIPVSALKIAATTYVVIEGTGAGWTKENIGALKVGKLLDLFWMVFNAVIPVFISYVRWHNEDPLIIDITSSAPIYIDDSSGEDPLVIDLSSGEQIYIDDSLGEIRGPTNGGEDEANGGTEEHEKASHPATVTTENVI